MTVLAQGLGGAAGFGEGVLQRNDDSFQQIDITSVFPQGMNFFGVNYGTLWINNNGNVTFASGESRYRPDALSGATGNPVIAPFFADVDTTGGPSFVSPGGTSQGTNLIYYDVDAASGVVTVTWDDVGYYDSHTNPVDAFQMQIIRRNTTDFDLVFRYEDIGWTSGDASGGTNGNGGVAARAGWSAGDGATYRELTTSSNTYAMLQLDEVVGNTAYPGEWAFSFRNGQAFDPLMSPRADTSDFGGNGHADVLWYNTQTHQVAEWSMQGFARTGVASVQDSVNPDWVIASTDDFNADGRADIMFRRASTGDIAIWTMNGLSRAGSAIATSATGPLSQSTRIAGTGDTNGDGRADIILHDPNSGVVSIGFTGADLAMSGPVTVQGVQAGWQAASVGDFNGDRRDDILWRHADGRVAIWTMDGAVLTGAGVVQAVDTGWTIEGTGDFNADGREDILWRHDDGTVATWLMNGLERVGAGVVPADPLSGDWQVADIADYSGEGVADVLFHNSRSGAVMMWAMANGNSVYDAQIIQDSSQAQWQVANDRAYV